MVKNPQGLPMKQAILKDIQSALSNGESHLHDIKQLMVYYYAGIGIHNGDEFITGFDKKASTLMPHDKNLISEILLVCAAAIDGVQDNQYMMHCIYRAGPQTMLDFYDRVKSDKDLDIVKCVVFMFCLERFTVCCLQDYTLTDTVLKETAGIYSIKNLINNMIKQKSLFVPVKAISIRKPLEIMQAQLACKITNISKSRFLMKLNILEAVMADTAQGNFANALAGLVLIATYLPSKSNILSQVYVQGGLSLNTQEHNDHWCDLYRVWNYALVTSQLKGCAFFGVKLLLPCVNGKQVDREFRNARIISLYGMLNLLMHGGNYNEYKSNDQRDKQLTRKLGLANLENALAYLVDLKTNIL